MDEKERTRALGATLGQIEKQFGKGSIIRLGALRAGGALHFHWIDFSRLRARRLAGFRADEFRRFSDLSHRAKLLSRCKWSLKRSVSAAWRRYIDVEHALDPVYARKLGVDIDNLLVSQPDYGEQAPEITNALIASGSDRRPGGRLGGRAGAESGTRRRNGRQLHGSPRPADVAGHAQADWDRVEVQHLPDFHQSDPRKDRSDVRHPETTTGGLALKFYSFVRADIRRIAANQGWRRRHRQPGPGDQGSSRTKWRPFRAKRIRHYLRRGDFVRRRSDRSGVENLSRRVERGTA